MTEALRTHPLPAIIEEAAHSMAPAFLRRRLMRAGCPYRSGDTTTFAYVGEADAVRAVHFMSRFPQIPPLERLEGTDLWHVTVELPLRSRIEYQFLVETQDRIAEIPDPLNTRTAANPFGVNSVAEGPGYTAPNWTTPGVDALKGTIDMVEIDSTAFGGPRTFSVYLPGGHDPDKRYAGVFLHDGSDLLEYAALTTVLDNLIGAGAIRPLVAVLMDPVARNREYMALPAHSDFVVHDVLPHVTETFGMSEAPEDLVIGGASLGAVASLATAWRNPGMFGSMLLCSGTFVTRTGGPWNRSEELQPVVDFMAGFRREARRPAERTWMACGAYEALSEDNLIFVPTLQNFGVRVRYSEPLDGHHWTSWRDSIGNGLRWLLPAVID